MSQRPIDPAELLAVDAAARADALDPTRSFIIDAPAGAGKTELLTQRFLRLLACVDEPEEIIALTFTNKAAAEMRDRIMRSLQDADSDPPEHIEPHKQITRDLATAVLAQDRARGWQLLAQPSRLRVMTLDALSARLARQMPLLSRFGTQPAVATDPVPYYEQAVRNTLDQLEDNTEDSQTIAQALTYFDNDAGRLQKMLVSMLARRDQWISKAIRHRDAAVLGADVAQALQALVTNRLADVVARFPAARQQGFMAAARYAADLSPKSPVSLLSGWEKPLTAEVTDLPRWRAVAELFLTQGNKPRSVYRVPIDIAGPKHQTQRQVLLDTIADLTATGDDKTLAAIRELPDPGLDSTAADLVASLAHLLELAYAQLWLVFNQEKVVDFGEIALKSVQALEGEATAHGVHERLDYRLKHLLVDEFQDTSPLQVALLTHLTQGWEGETDRSIFLVGDPMQSIYRFRKADVGLFLRVRQRGLGKIQPISLQLYRNNRSYPAVIDWINTTFAQVFATEDDIIRGAVRYESCVASKPNVADAGVMIHPVIAGRVADDVDTESGDAAPKSQADEQEAATIVDLIRTAQSENPEGTVAVLVRARPHLDALVLQLQRHAPDIPFRAVEIDPLAGRQSVQDLVSLTRALHTPGDRVHWLAILRAPWCGLTLPDLHHLAADDHVQSLWSLMQDDARMARLSEDGRTRLSALREVLRIAYANRGLQRPRRWVEGVWHALGGTACLHQASDVADVEAYFRLLDTLDTHGGLELDRLDAALGKLYAAADTREASDRVQLMTIHKSKGLQFDTVILPGLHRIPPHDEHPLLLWDTLILDEDGQEHLVVAPAPAQGDPEGTATPYSLLRGLERTRAQNEDRRVLYVAATRAIRRLHLLGMARRDPKEDSETGLKPPAGTSLLAPLWPRLVNDFVAAAAVPAPPAPPASNIDPARFVPGLVRVVSPCRVDPAPESTPEDITETEAAYFSSTLDMDIGSLVHQYLEAIARDGLDAWVPERLETLQPRFVETFRQLGHLPEQADEAAAAVHDTLQRALTDPQSRWILGPHTEAGCEVPLSSAHPSSAIATDTASPEDGDTPAIRRHVIDRTFIENNIRWIIDYKTLRTEPHVSEAALEAQLTEKAESYRPQLERYATLYAHEAAQGICIRMAIFFPAHGKLIPIEHDSQGSAHARQ